MRPLRPEANAQSGLPSRLLCLTCDVPSVGHCRPAHHGHRPGRPRRQRQDPGRSRYACPNAGVRPRTRHPANNHYRGADRYQGRWLRGEVRHQGRRMHWHPRPPSHLRRPDRRPSRPRPRPPPHRRMPPPRQTAPAQRPAAGRLGAHARLPRPLLHQEPDLLHHPRLTPRRPHRPPAPIRHRRRAATRPRPQHHARRHRLALRRTRAPAHRSAGRRYRPAVEGGPPCPGSC